MTDADHLHHITLDTGDVRRSPRAEVRDHIVADLRESMRDTLADPGGRTPIPAIAGYSYSASAGGGALLVTIWGTIDRSPAPVATFGVARDQAAARALWPAMHHTRPGLESSPYLTTAGEVPTAPWIAARMEIGATLIAATDLLWMADFERVMAWAWIEQERT
jgi:hypothetical protein